MSGKKAEVSSRLIGERATSRLQFHYSSLTRRFDYELSAEGRRAQRALRRYANRHIGGTAVVIGNGPSLNRTDLRQLGELPVFTANRFYLHEAVKFEGPQYHVVVNPHVARQSAVDLKALEMPIFSAFSNAAYLQGSVNPVLYFPSIPGPRFSVTPYLGLWEGGTVTYVSIQLAFFMGFAKVVLVGVDHSFATSGPANALVESEGDDPNHFSSEYFGRGYQWQLPDLVTSEVAYSLARSRFTAAGREIVDCTVGGKLDIFRRGDLAAELERTSR